MEGIEIARLAFGIAAFFAFGQTEAAGMIGNRTYSIWYDTHLLIEKKSICRLIYFKPKHFGRYTLHEALSFFTSYLLSAVFGILCIFCANGSFSVTVLLRVIGVAIGVTIGASLLVALLNDVGDRRDQKKTFYAETGKREFTVYHLWASYRVRLKETEKSPQQREQVNLEYIEYFKNVTRLIVLKENDNGSLQLRVKL